MLWKQRMQDDTPLLQLRQLSDIESDGPHLAWVNFWLGCEDWVGENQLDPTDCPDYVGLVWDPPLPDWIQIISRDGYPTFLVNSGAHLVDVYGKSCTWYHWRSSEELKENTSLLQLRKCRQARRVQNALLGRGAIMLNRWDPDYDKYEGPWKDLRYEWEGTFDDD